MERLLEENAEQRAKIAELQEALAEAKGLKGRPKLKPSGMDKKAERRAKAKQARKQRRKSRGAKKLKVDEERVLETPHPAGSRFKGYEDYVVQDVILKRCMVRYRRERWLTPDGRSLVAPLPAGVRGHFGPGLRRLLLAFYHEGQTTSDRLVSLLAGIGVEISKRQVLRLLSEGQEGFLAEADAVLESGLATAAWISVDDTGARHQVRNGTTLQIGNDHFTWFTTTFSKSRLNFLAALRAGDEGYVVNEAALAYMSGRNLAGGVIACLAAAEVRVFADFVAWQGHLESLGITALEVHPDPVKIASEGALWGAIHARRLLQDAVILSDDAGQFNVGLHALCWIHAERLIHKLTPVTEAQRRAKQRIQRRLWWLYADLKAYQAEPEMRRGCALTRRFDALFTTRTGYATLDRLLVRLHANKKELLVVLDRPEVPLHTNGSENDLRCQVTRRKISGGTRSDAGKDAKDAFLGLMKTCKKLGISFWDYLGDRLNVPGAKPIENLPQIIRTRQTAPT